MPYTCDIPYDDGTHIHLWEVTETTADLMALCQRRGIDTSRIPTTVKATTRRNEMLVERLLLLLIFGQPLELHHTDDGQPYVVESNMFLSVSHTYGMVCIAVNADHRIGIDVERKGTRVLRVRDKFLNEAEQGFIPLQDAEAHLIAWTAKEALFKVHGERSVSLCDDIKLDKFKAATAGLITFMGHCGDSDYAVITRSWYDHILTLATPAASYPHPLRGGKGKAGRQ